MNDIDAELLRIQQISIEHAIEEMDAAAERGVKTTVDRGDRGFLTGMAAKSLGVAVRIEQFLALRRGEGGGDDDHEEQEQKAKVKLVSKSKAEVAKIMERVGAGNQPRR
jgi:hypothetical protein